MVNMSHMKTTKMDGAGCPGVKEHLLAAAQIDSAPTA